MNKKFSHILAVHKRGLQELHKVSPKLFPLSTFSAIVSALIPYVTVFFSAQILKELALQRRADVLWKWVIVSVLSMGAMAILSAFLKRRFETLFNDVWGRKEILFCRKAFSLDYADVDKQETLDLRNQIMQNENWAGWGLCKVPDFYEQVIRSVIGILSGIALTVSLFSSPVPESAGWLTVLNHPLFILVFAVVMICISLLAGKLYAKSTDYWSGVSEEATFGNRLYNFFGFIGTQKERASDMRIYNQQKLVEAYWGGNGENYRGNGDVFGAEGIIGKLAQGPLGIYAGLSVCVSTLITGFVYVFTCLKAWGGAFDVGSITQYVGAATALASNVYAILQVYGAMKSNAEYLEKTYEYLDIPNAMYQGSLTTEKRSDRQYEVEFRDVSFKYPGSDIWALRHVNMKFKVGKRLAIVGENGSGKTTFIKLLCRLYDPQEGQILLNGIDIRKYRYDDYMNIFSVVFQDFQLICQPLGANVAGSMEYDRDRVRKALIDAGFGDRLATMEKGLDTMLYKDLAEDGVDVSGGEAQKIAIARALYKNAPFIILDEPTAALDPIAEAEIYSKFNDITGDKTAIYISHRLSSCKFCDEIAVFHEGSVIQQGSHDALLCDADGKYYELWNAQAQYYTTIKEA